MTASVAPPVANAVARGLDHRPGPWRDFGVMRTSKCQRCGLYMILRTDDGKGVTGPAIETKCKGA